MKRPKPTVTRTQELVLAPQVRTFAGRRYLGALVAIPLLVVTAYFAVRRLASLEEMLAAEGERAARVVVYELASGFELHAPIEPKTDVMRFVVHAYRRGADLELSPRRARVRIAIAGERAQRTERFDVEPPGERTRVTAGEEGLSLGDPASFDVDVHDTGPGELALTLEEVNGADGLLVRVYRREQLSPAETALRGATLDRVRKDQLARWAWETGWDELTRSEQQAILGTRWHRLGALRGTGRDLRSIAIAQAPHAALLAPASEDTLLGRIALRGDERVALMLREGGTLRARSDSAATLRAVVRAESGAERVVEGAGAIEVASAPGALESVELSCSRDALVEVRALDPSRVDWLGNVRAWRASRSRPVIVESPDAERILRLTLRRPVDRRDGRAAVVAADLEIRMPSGKISTRAFRAERPRSRIDRYAALDPVEAPSERAMLYVVLPKGATARVAPPDETPLDVALSELDPRTPAEPLAVRAVDAPPPAVKLEGEVSWPGFVARRPSNAAAFGADQQLLIRVARRWGTFAPPTGEPPLVRVHPTGAARVERESRSFEEVARSFDVDLDGRRPAYLPLRLSAAEEAWLAMTVAPASPVPRRSGAFDRVTLRREMHVGAGDWRATFVVGDDLPPGKYRLTITPASSRVLVHMPWAAPHRAAAGPRWIAGQFED
jgi:hypothetical protein